MVFGLKRKWGAKATRTVSIRLDWLEDALDLINQDLIILDQKIEKSRNPESSIVKQQFLKVTNHILHLEEELENLKEEIPQNATKQRERYRKLRRESRYYHKIKKTGKLKNLTAYLKSVKK